jgi:hypothetical protein
MTGWRGNDLGLTRWQVELVHKAAEAVRWRISDLVHHGMSFEDAKATAIKQARPSWRGFSPEVAEGVRRVTASYRLGDVERSVKKHLHSRALVEIETMRGKKAGRIERAIWRVTGLTF